MPVLAAMWSKRLVVLYLSLMIGACGGDRDGAPPDESLLASLPGVYSGIFPCDGCPGIPTTLWLRADGRFFIEQQNPAVDGREAMDAYNLGRWAWISGDEAITQGGAGPTRTFKRRDRNVLIMQTASEIEHLLNRDVAAGRFSATIRLAGMMRMRGNNASFEECLTGFIVPVDRNREFSKFLHQYRSAGKRGEPTFVEFDGRYSWASDGMPQSLTIRRFVSVKEDSGQNCRSDTKR